MLYDRPDPRQQLPQVDADRGPARRGGVRRSEVARPGLEHDHLGVRIRAERQQAAGVAGHLRDAVEGAVDHALVDRTAQAVGGVATVFRAGEGGFPDLRDRDRAQQHGCVGGALLAGETVDLGLRGEAPPHERPPHALSEPPLGQQQVVVGGPPPGDERREHTGLEGQEQRLARGARLDRGDVVREYPVQEVLRVRPGDADEVPWTEGDAGHRR